MGLVLGILAEAKSHYNKEKHEWINYCNMNQFVYMDIGYETGVPIGRIVIELNTQYSKSLTELFIKLAKGEYVHPMNGKQLQYTDTPFHHISNTNNLLMGGDVLYGNGSGGCAPINGKVYQEALIHSNVTNTKGKVVLLSTDTDPTLFTSIFYILLDDCGPTVVDGCVIGDIIEGFDILEDIVLEYGTINGVPKQKIVIHKAGHL